MAQLWHWIAKPTSTQLLQDNILPIHRSCPSLVNDNILLSTSESRKAIVCEFLALENIP